MLSVHCRKQDCVMSHYGLIVRDFFHTKADRRCSTIHCASVLGTLM